MNEKKNGVRATWAGIIVVLLGAAFTLYGQFSVMRSRMDEADQDRHAVMERLDQLESEVQELQHAIEDDLTIRQQGGHH